MSNYLSIYQQQRAALLNRRGGLVPGHPDSVATTWSLAFEHVEGANPAAIELMRFCAFLSPDAIPEELISEGAPHLGPVLQPVAADRSRLNAALAELLKYSLIRRDATTHTLTIHRLVQAVIKDEMDEETQRHWAERAVRATRQVFPFDEPPPWSRSQRYLPHALVCEELIKQWNLTLDEAAALLNNAGCYLRNRGQYREAAPLMQDALTIGETRYGRDHPDTYYLLDNLALLYTDQGKYEEAEPLYQRALAIKEKVLGPEHPDTANTLNNLAVLYYVQGKYEEAEPLYQRALAIKEKVLGPEHPDTASTLNNLANIYYTRASTRRPSRSTSVPWPSKKRCLALSTPLQRPHSTTWQSSTLTRASTRRPSRSTSVPWPSKKRCLALSTPIPRTHSTTWQTSTMTRASTRRPSRSTSAPWPSEKRSLVSIIPSRKELEKTIPISYRRWGRKQKE